MIDIYYHKNDHLLLTTILTHREKIISDFYSLDKNKTVNEKIGKVVPDEEYEEIIRLTYIDLRNTGKHLSLGLGMHEELYIVKTLNQEAELSLKYGW